MEKQTPTQTQFLPHLQVILSMLFVGSSVPVAKELISEVPIFIALFLRYFICLISIFIAIKLFKLPTIQLSRNQIMALLFQALLGVFLYPVALFYGVTQTDALIAGVILGTLPAVTGILSIFFLKEKLNWYYAIGIIFAVGGVIIANLHHAEKNVPGNSGLIGIVLILVAVLGQAGFTVVGKVNGTKLSAVMMAYWLSLIGSIMFLPFALVESIHFDFHRVSTTTTLLLLYYGVIVTALGYYLFYSGLPKLPAMVSGVYSAAAPLAAMLIAVIFLGETLTWSSVIAALLILVAIVVISLRPHK